MVFGFPPLTTENASWIGVLRHDILEWPAESPRLVGILALVKNELLLEELSAASVVSDGLTVLLNDTRLCSTPEGNDNLADGTVISSIEDHATADSVTGRIMMFGAVELKRETRRVLALRETHLQSAGEGSKEGSGL